MELIFTPGAVVRLPTEPAWGEGRVQSAIGSKVTVDFTDRGKVTLDTRYVQLELIRRPREG